MPERALVPETSGADCFRTRERIDPERVQRGVSPSDEQMERDFPHGERLGKYQLLGLIGEGGMGRVYCAWDPALRRKVALKLVPFADSQDLAKARFEREVQSLAVLSHPNVVTIYDFCSDGLVCFAVMEYLHGSTLRKVLEDGALSVRDCLSISSQIARGLAAAHERGIVHRDVKPENAVVTHTGQVKLLDFGLSMRFSPFTDSPTSTPIDPVDERGDLAGTIAYMSPEQVQGGDIDFRSDVFAFGVVLFEMLTGRHPFSQGTLRDRIASILHDAPATAPCRDRLSARIERIARRCLSKRSAERYESAEPLARLLSRLHEEYRSAEGVLRATDPTDARGHQQGV